MANTIDHEVTGGGGGGSRRRVRCLGVLTLVALLGSLLGVAVEVVEPPTPASAGTPEAVFIATTPCRVVDTRAGVPSVLLGPGSNRTFQVGGTGGAFAAQGGADGGCGVPESVEAVELSFTAISPTAANGFLRAGPAGSPPAGTILNYTVGTGITNTGTVELSTGGPASLAVTNFGGTIHLAIDVQGYYVRTSGPRFVPVTPCRMVDTRASSPAGPFAVNETRTFRVAGSGIEDLASPGIAPQGGVAGGCGVPENATAVELTVTAASPEGAGFVRVGPNTPGDPTGTVLNFTSAQGITNTAAVAFVGDGRLKVKVFGARTQVLIDVQGYYVATGAISEFTAVAPCRVVDTRAASTPTPLAAGETRSFGVAGTSLSGQGGLSNCAIPTGAAAVEVSITATSPAGNGFLRVWPSGNPEPPATILNYASGRGITNTATVPLARVGSTQLSVRNLGGSSHVIMDVQGYFTGPRGASGVTVGNGFGCVVHNSDPLCWGANVLGQLGRGTQSLAPGLQPQRLDEIAGMTQIDAGRDHACALTLSQDVTCWGSNSDGQLGLGPALTSVSSPTTITSPPIVGMVDVSAGYDHTCAVRDDGTVWCWGLNSSGQLGNGSTLDSNVPVQVSGLIDASQVSAGYTHTCARSTSGIIRCWGSGFVGQLGNGSFSNSSVPVAVPGIPPSRIVAAGAFSTCADDESGGIRCWGDNSEGQLGTGTKGAGSATPVVATIGDAAGRSGSLAGGFDGFCAVTSVSELFCWGDGRSFLFADGDVRSRTTPTLVRRQVLSVSLGGNFGTGAACVVEESGGVRCWGSGSSFGDQTATGNPFSGAAATPASGPPLPSGSSVSLSESFPAGWGCALGGGSIRCWGNNRDGQLGDGTTDSRITPAVVSGLGGTPTQISTGAEHACAVVAGGVRCWGRGLGGELGDGLASTSSTPVAVTGLGGTATQVAAAAGTTCAVISPAGTVRCWGVGPSGQLGNGTNTFVQAEPVTVTGLSGVTQLTAGRAHFCAVTGGQVRCWGSGLRGQLGQGVASSSNVPVAVSGSTGATRVAAGDSHSCAQLSSGGVQCWGGNDSGQLADGTATDRSTPVNVSGLSGASSLTSSGFHTCVVTAGTVRCWGRNDSSQLGDGTYATRTAPTPVVGLVGAVAVEAGSDTTCARLSDGSPRCWGSRNSGGLGSAPASATPRPVQQFGF